MRIPAFSWTFFLQLQNGASLSGQLESDSTQVRFTRTALTGGYRLQLKYFPEGKQKISACRLQVATATAPEEWLLCNGFQSWTESYWRRPSERIPQLRRIARPLMGYYGDYHINWIPRHKGALHSWSWTERRSQGDQIELLASVNENTAFTCFQWLSDKGQLQVEIDCRGWEVNEPKVLADFVVLEGNVDTVYDEWVQQMRLPPIKAPVARGWTSWYQHYTNISEGIIRENLAAFKIRGRKIDFFQIDDGFQTAVGDWLSLTKSFPNGMKKLASDITEQGVRPGLWLAPCIADRRSQILKDHPEWVTKDPSGRPLKAGFNPLWKGWFYALNPEHEGWQAYMQQVFQTVVQNWGYAMLKLDFLYAACIYPTPQYTRAQLMRRTLERIRAWAGDETFLLGCGTPLASGFGLFDYCRIGADIHLEWEHKLLRWFRHRERVSTLAALRSVLGRSSLAGRVWRNDPDVYLLRDENIKLTPQERQLVHRLNTPLGELLFTSDNPATYGEFQAKEEQWQDNHWQKGRWQVTPQENACFLLSNGVKNWKVTLGKETGSMREEKR
ncbi:MAG: glycoside hydrolase family 36 protein [Bacteroidota bacterium]